MACKCEGRGFVRVPAQVTDFDWVPEGWNYCDECSWGKRMRDDQNHVDLYKELKSRVMLPLLSAALLLWTAGVIGLLGLNREIDERGRLVITDYQDLVFLCVLVGTPLLVAGIVKYIQEARRATRKEKFVRERMLATMSQDD